MDLELEEVEMKPERGVLLQEFSRGHRRPNVYLIWERQIGSVEKVGLCCICSNQEEAAIRVRGLNSNSFWSKAELEKPTIYNIEECEIDHLFAASMIGYDMDLDTLNERMVRAKVNEFVGFDKVEIIRRAARDKINELEAVIKELKAQKGQ